MNFKKYADNDYEAVCDFLVKLNDRDRSHINWNWARFEWMYEHPEFNKELIDSIGLWLDDGKVIGAAIYDMYLGEGFCGVLPEYLYPEILDYACINLKDDSGFSIAVCDDNTEEIDMILNKGFDHGEDKQKFEKEGIATPRARRHFNRDLCVAACNNEGELVSICSLWYNPKTDYVYVEPVCTIPSHRGRGVAKAVIHEALKRTKKLGAKRAFVISDIDFYTRLGFRNKYHYSFYQKQGDCENAQ